MDWSTQKLNTSLKDNLNNLKESIKLYFYKPDDDFTLMMDVIGAQTMDMSSEVTEYYVENNSFYNDQISFKPRIYTIQGEVGELAWYNKDIPQTTIGFLNQKLMPIVEFHPIRSMFSSQVMNTISKVQQWIETADNLWTRISKMVPNLSKQQQSFLYIQTLVANREPISITTPWVIMESAVITSVKFTQPERTTERTQISMTVKDFRTVEQRFESFKKDEWQGRMDSAMADWQDSGLVSGNKTILKAGMDTLTGAK